MRSKASATHALGKNQVLSAGIVQVQLRCVGISASVELFEDVMQGASADSSSSDAPDIME